MSKSVQHLNTIRNKAGFNRLPAMIRFIIMILAIVCSQVGMSPTSVLAAPTTYYVDNTSSVGTCDDTTNTGLTPGDPFCTIGKAGTIAVAGDTVSVLAGTYAETVNGSNSGSAGLPITYTAAPGVIVTGSGTAMGNAFRMSGKSYIVVEGFTITLTVDYGIYVYGSDHITISNNHVSYSGSPVDGSTRQGIYFNNTTDSTITGNTVDHNTRYGIHLTNFCSNIMISDNVVFANAEEWQRNANGIRLDYSSNNTILHNITYANEDSGLNFYNASSSNLVIGNLSYGNGDHGIDFNASPNNTVVGNTVHGNVTSGINFEGAISPGSGYATVENNIMVDNGLRLLVGGGTATGQPGNLRFDDRSLDGNSLDYNIYDLNSGTVQIVWNGTDYTSLAAFKASADGAGQETEGLEADPLFVAPAPVAERNVSEPYWVAVNVGDYHLTTGSPAIDSANSNASGEPSTDIEGNARVDDPVTSNTGAGSRDYDDRGAYEFQPLYSEPTVTTQAVTDITQTSATGNGNVTDLGVPDLTQHGFVWSESPDPTTADSKTEEGTVSATGAFTSNITGLAAGKLYHVRAYATNLAGTAYGGDVSFTTLPSSTDTFTTPGLVTWTAPEGVTSVTVEVWGAGGGGANRTNGGGNGSGGGGGGGAYALKNDIAVVPGTDYDLMVGAGGTSGTDGGDSYFIDATTVLAQGGHSATTDSITGAAGGLASASVGDTKYDGGGGADGSGTTYGGGGGSSAGTGAAGVDATGSTGAIAPTGGGNGGDGAISNGDGSPGSLPGGGGGGSLKTAPGARAGGSGAAGQVIIYYAVVVESTTTSVDCGGGSPSVLNGNSITCQATVTATAGTISPTGDVSWATDGAGTFTTSPCTLSGSGGSATCSVDYTPTAVGSGSHLITASYAGSTAFLPSSGDQLVTVIPAYTVTYDGNGSDSGTAPTDGSSPYIEGATVTVLANIDLAKTNYTFVGWNTQADGNGIDYIATNTFLMPAANVILYAKWVADTYTVTYDGNGSDSGSAPTDGSSPYVVGATVTVLANIDLAKTDYTFVGWNTQADGNGIDYIATNTFLMPAANVTLYAKWVADTYTVTYDGNGSDSGTAPVDVSSPYVVGATVTVLANTDLARTDYTFAGWNTQADGLGTDYVATDTFLMPAANVTLYAKWTHTIYTLILRSQAKYDGWVLESGEFTSEGGTKNNLGKFLLLGDNVADKQYRDILSFGTAAIPDNAVITRVILTVKNAGVVGTDPMTTHNDLVVDVKKGKFYTLPALQINDWQAKPRRYKIGKFPNKLYTGNWYRAVLIKGAYNYGYINKLGRTQFRLRFLLQDNDNNLADILKLYSGNADLVNRRPRLIIKYYVP